MPTTENKNTSNAEKNNVNTFGIITIVVFIWLISWVLLDCFIPAQEETRSSFGDKFGAVNSLFAALAFAGIIITILLQRKELQLQREELQLQRSEQVATREVFEAQNEMLSQEKFENTFFQMLSLFHSIVNAMDIRENDKKDVIKSGRDCFSFFYSKFEKELKIELFNKNAQNLILDDKIVSLNLKDLDKHDFTPIYGKIYTEFRSDLSHYFRTYYHLIKLIDNSDIKNKQQYASIARAQLSSYEQILLFYNCLHSNGNEKFKPLIEKYALFKNLDSELLFSLDHLNLYKGTAFENNIQ